MSEKNSPKREEDKKSKVKRERRGGDNNNDDSKEQERRAEENMQQEAAASKPRRKRADNDSKSPAGGGEDGDGGGWMSSSNNGGKSMKAKIKYDEDDIKDTAASSANKDKHFQDDNDEIMLIPDLDEEGGGDADQRIAHAPRNVNRRIPTLAELELEVKAALPNEEDGFNLNVLLGTLVPATMVYEADVPWTFESLLREITDELSNTPKTVLSASVAAAAPPPAAPPAKGTSSSGSKGGDEAKSKSAVSAAAAGVSSNNSSFMSAATNKAVKGK